VRGHLDLLLLGALAGGPGHGYAIISRLRDESDGVFDLAEGLVYPALHRLEAAHLVSSTWTTVDGRRRREYRLTTKGIGALTVERRDWQRLVGAVNAVLGSGSKRPAGRPV
jgi:DNA-binding PadR family transcriptional regulator